MTPRPAAGPFTVKAALLMVLVGVFGFAAFTVLSAYAPDLRSGRDGGGHALSTSAVGYGALVRLASDVGVPVVVSRSARTAGGGLVVLTPGERDGEALKAAIERNQDRALLVILPKWDVTPLLTHPGWVAKTGLVSGLPDLPGARLTMSRRSGVGGLRVTDVESNRPPVDIGAIDDLQTISSSGWTPALVDQRGGWLVARSKDLPNLLVVSDPDLFNTQGIKSRARARLAVLTLNDLRGGEAVVFDVTLNGFERSRGVLKLALEPPFLAATLCALAAAVLMGLHAVARFGAPRPPERALALGKKALADNSAALLRLARREPAMAVPYADLTRQAVAAAVAAPKGLDRDGLDAMLDRLAAKAKQAHSATALFAEADKVRDTHGLMAVARKLYEFRRGMTRERD